ncbi:MAG: site-specific integrase [Myxococcota bacterium]
MGSTYGLGSVRRRKDGRFEWRSPARLDGKRKSLFEKSERAARSAGRRWLLSDPGKAWMSARLEPTAEEHTLATAADAFLKSSADRLRTATRKTYDSHLRVHALPKRGHIPLVRLTPKHFESLYADLRRATVSLRSVQATHIALRQVTRFTVEQEWLAADPMQTVRRPGGAKQAKVKQGEIRYWTKCELKAILTSAHSVLRAQHALLFEVLAGTGCRISEALGLQFRDVRSEKVTFERTWSKARQVEPTKSGSSRRTISITTQLVAFIQAERERRGARLDDWIFDAGHGTPMDQDNVRRRLLTKVIAAADVPARTLHEIRHTHATLLLEAGTSMKVIQHRLGHADIATTIETYAHLTPVLEGAAIEAIDTALT